MRKSRQKAALRDGKAIVERLSAATPSTKNPTDIVKNIAAEIESSVGCAHLPRDSEVWRCTLAVEGTISKMVRGLPLHLRESLTCSLGL